MEATRQVATRPGADARPEREQLRLLLEQIPGAVWTTDRALRITYAIGRLRDGEPMAEAIGLTVGQFAGRDEPDERAVAEHHAALTTGIRRSFRYGFRGRCYEVLVEPLRDAHGAVLGTVGVALDVTERRASEDQLAESEARLAAAQRVAHVGSWTWDVVHDRVRWSDEMYRIYGLGPEQFGGTLEAFLALLDPADRASSQEVVLGALRAVKPFVYDHRIVRPDGSVRMLHTRGEVQADEQGRATQLFGSCLDITDRWQAGLEIERSVSLLRATLESTADGILVVDREGKISAFNQRFMALWRLAPETLAAGRDQTALEAVLPQLEDPNGFLDRVRELYAQPEVETFDVVRFLDGRIFERYSQPQRVGSEVVGRVWSFRDVTDRERLLRRAIFLADASRLLGSLDVEPALEAVAHIAVPFVGDACAIDLISDEGGPRRLLAVGRDGHRPALGEIQPAIFTGHALIYSVGTRSQMAVPLTARGALRGVLTFAAREPRRYTQADLTLAEELARRVELALENARLYRHAQEALRARDEFLSVAAHEIRGPVTALHLAAQSLRKGVLNSEVTDRALAIVEREDRRLARFVDELLDVARARSGQLHFDFEDVDLGEIARAVATRLNTELARSGSSLSVSAAAGVIGVWDRVRIEQVVTNLLSNAIKFGQGRPIELSVSVDGERARLVVIDHGIGIPPDRINAIFQPFERAVSVRHYGGLGLGLYIVRTIVEGLGGCVRAESKVDEGTRIVVELPLGRPA